MQFGDRLRLARTRAGLTMAALADKLEPKVTAQAVNKYEKGEMMPSSSVLLSLAQALNLSLDFLMTSQVSELQGVEFRKSAGVKEKEKALVEEEVIDFVERYLAVESVLGLADEATALDGVNAVEIDDIEDAEDVAKDIRLKWSLGDDPIPSMTSLLEERNIRVFDIDGVDGFYGMTCRVVRPANKPPIPVIVRRHANVERDRFTLGHEIAHAFIGGCKNGKFEKAIDRCAAALLVPADHLRGELGSNRKALSYAELVHLKHLYAVSMWALLMRLTDLKIISDANMRNMYRIPTTRAWLKSEPQPLEEDGNIAELETPRRFESLVYRALAEGLIRPNRAAQLLRKPVGDVEAAVRGPSLGEDTTRHP